MTRLSHVWDEVDVGSVAVSRASNYRAHKANGRCHAGSGLAISLVAR